MNLRINLYDFTTLACVCLAACIGPEPKPDTDAGANAGASPIKYGAGTGGKAAGSGGSRAGEGGERAGAGGDPEGGNGGDGGESKAGRGGVGGKPVEPPPEGGTGGRPTPRAGTGGTPVKQDPPDQCAPCSTDADCAAGEDCNGLWCTTTCSSDVGCGTSPKGVQNICITSLSKDHTCFPGCVLNSDCTSLYPGTTCQASASGSTICSKTSSSTFPCRTATDCDNQLTCIATRWCSPTTCSTDSDCGLSPARQQSRCVENAQNNHVCFPGCATNADCSYFPDTTCAKLASGNSVCTTGTGTTTPPTTGTVCAADSECGSAMQCIGTASSPGWCSPLTCSSNTDCGTSPAGRANKCLQNGYDDNVCFPGCISNSDCVKYPDTTCMTTLGVCAGMSSSD